MCFDVVVILELVRDEDVRVLLRHIECHLDALLDTFADVVAVVNETHLSAVLADQHTAFLADRVRHDDDDFIALHGAHKGQSDALVAAGGFHDDGVGADDALFFRRFDHLERGAGLDGTADIEALELDEDFGIFRAG